MYLSTYEERENGTMYEEAYEGHNLSKLHLCDEGKDAWTAANTHINTHHTHCERVVAIRMELLLTVVQVCFCSVCAKLLVIERFTHLHLCPDKLRGKVN